VEYGQVVVTVSFRICFPLSFQATGACSSGPPAISAGDLRLFLSPCLCSHPIDASFSRAAFVNLPYRSHSEQRVRALLGARSIQRGIPQLSVILTPLACPIFASCAIGGWPIFAPFAKVGARSRFHARQFLNLPYRSHSEQRVRALLGARLIQRGIPQPSVILTTLACPIFASSAKVGTWKVSAATECRLRSWISSACTPHGAFTYGVLMFSVAAPPIQKTPKVQNSS
jgi:hypothetical protein